MFWIILCVLVAAEPTPPVNPEEGVMPANSAMAEHARFVLQGMKDSRDRLVTGKFRARGHKKRAEQKPVAPAIDHDVEFTCFFDFGADRFRFDGQDWEIAVLPEDAAGLQPQEDGEPVAFPLGKVAPAVRKYVRTSKSTLHWSEDVSHSLVARVPEEGPSSLPTVFDVRCMGLAFKPDIESFLEFPDLWQILNEQEIVEVTEETNGLHRVVWTYGEGNCLKRTVWFDEKLGYSPVRLEGHIENVLTQSCEASWDKISDVWVPSTLRLEKTRNGKLDYGLELIFEWVSVNEPIAELPFTAEGLELSPGTDVISTQLGGRPISLGKIGEEVGEPPPKRIPGPRRMLVFAVSLLLLVLILTIVIVVQRHKAAD